MPQAKRISKKIATTRRKPGLRLFKEKQVRPEYIESFWRDWKKPKKIAKHLVLESEWARKVWAISPNVVATVRRFSTEKEARAYVKNVKIFEKKIAQAKPELFVLQPVQFLDIKGPNVLERVYPGPDCWSLFQHQGISRYAAALKRRLKRKGVDLDNRQQFKQLSEIVWRARVELHEILIKLELSTPRQVDTLLLDFNPKTKKVLLAGIDREHPPSKYERSWNKTS